MDVERNSFRSVQNIYLSERMNSAQQRTEPTQEILTAVADGNEVANGFAGIDLAWAADSLGG
jgi:hypothetical protein